MRNKNFDQHKFKNQHVNWRDQVIEEDMAQKKGRENKKAKPTLYTIIPDDIGKATSP